ncbi:MAG: hypothetical protein AVDCRST_MAG18-3120, partial [uncultured Thermomicrobiales bacterium]
WLWTSATRGAVKRERQSPRPFHQGRVTSSAISSIDSPAWARSRRCSVAISSRPIVGCACLITRSSQHMTIVVCWASRLRPRRSSMKRGAIVRWERA